MKYSSLVLSLGLLVLSCAISVVGAQDLHFVDRPAVTATLTH